MIEKTFDELMDIVSNELKRNGFEYQIPTMGWRKGNVYVFVNESLRFGIKHDNVHIQAISYPPTLVGGTTIVESTIKSTQSDRKILSIINDVIAKIRDYERRKRNEREAAQRTRARPE